MKSIRQSDESLKPREKALQQGIESLSDGELLSLLLCSGSQKKPLQLLCIDILQSCGGLAGLNRMSIRQMMAIDGLGPAKSCVIAACREIMKRVNYQDILKRDVISNPESLFQYLKKSIGAQDSEYFVVFYLDNKSRIITHKQLAKGGSSSVSVDTKSVFHDAIELKASGIIAAHNHPSQSTEPSQMDRQMTRQLVEAGQLLNIPLMDHIIVSYDHYFSFRQDGFIQ